MRKPRNAKTIRDQTKLVTKNAFEIIYNSRTHIKDYLLSGGYIYNLQYPDHKWKFNNAGKKIKNFLHRVKIVTSLWVFDRTSILNNIFFATGPRQPLFYVASTPNASPNTSSDWEKFPEDTHICDSDPDEGHSTLTLAAEMSHQQTRRYILRPPEALKSVPDYSPSSSPIPIPSPDVFVISSDEELEMSMIKLGHKLESKSTK